MKTEEQIRKEIEDLYESEKSLISRTHSLGEIVGLFAISGRNSVRIAALKWVLDEQKVKT